ncbi:HTTM domain-containing protein [Aquimarina longa]|uniref:HTTM domain-containing protein n=1 Tax=Aquimarina longa TaxID=1080221 RepID=UPI00078176D3|nr:HTTM domain-containing protein [Aquimarina longa]
MHQKIQNIFSFDLRLLGVFRILLGILIIIDIINRSQDLTIFYTDQGIYPRALLLQNDWNLWNFSINMITGSYEGQIIIFLVTILCALMVTIGFRTKFFLISLYFLIISIHVRNPYIVHGGDLVIKLLVFYAIFLPINARYAVDKFKESSLPKSNKIVSVATVIYILQIVYIYVCSGILKTGVEWSNGTAIYYALELDIFSKPLAAYLKNMPELMQFLTNVTIYLEKFGCILLFIPVFWKYFRLIGVFLFAMLHFSFFLFMALGNFPWAALIMWIVVLPPLVPDFIEKHCTKYKIYSHLILIRNQIRKTIALPVFNLKITEQVFNTKRNGISSLFLILIGVSVFLWNMSTINVGYNCPEFFKKVIRITGTWQKWNMFAASPMKIDGWFVMDAQLRNGKHIDILNNKDTVVYRKPKNVNATYKNERWQKYLTTIVRNQNNEKYLQTMGRYYCNSWNIKYINTPNELESFSIYFMKEITQPPNHPKLKAKKTILWNHWCKEEFKTRFK